MVAETITREGEANFLEKLFESDKLDSVIQEAVKRNLTFDRLRMDRIVLDGPWESTEKSTTLLPVIYLKNGKAYDHLIAKRSEDEKYGLFKYRWTA